MTPRTTTATGPVVGCMRGTGHWMQFKDCGQAS